MTVQFHVLASGSAGNACVLEVDGFGVLIDFGLSPRQLEPRMKHCRVSWERIHAVLLTHNHTDHWQAATLAHFAKLRLPIFCHEEHLRAFDQDSRAFSALSAASLFRHYEPGERLQLHEACHCLPIALSHDAAMTNGFRFEGAGWAIGYAADLGCWQPALARQFADVDLLALEFNHDVEMQLASGRHPHLIRRVLGDAGHLSNAQAADMLAEIMRISARGRLRNLVQLHLSRQCNRAELAHSHAQQVADRLGMDLSIHPTDQERAGPSITLGELMRPEPRFVQPILPFAVASGEAEA